MNTKLLNDLENAKNIGPALISELYNLSVQMYNTTKSKEKTNLLKGFIKRLNDEQTDIVKSIWRLMFNDFYRYNITEKFLTESLVSNFGAEAADFQSDEYLNRDVNGLAFRQLIDCLILFLSGSKGKKATSLDLSAIIYKDCDTKVIDLFLSIIRRDWGVGVTTTTFNKLFSEPFIPVFSVTKALEIELDDLDNLGEDGDYFFIEIKYDGTRDFTVVPKDCSSPEQIYTLSSSGRVLYIPELQKELFAYLEKTNFTHTGFVVDGELTVKDSILSHDRGKVTGWHSSAMKLAAGMNSNLDIDWSKNVSFNAFDILDLDEFETNTLTEIPLVDRKRDLEGMMIAFEFSCLKLGEYTYCSKAELKEKTTEAYHNILAKGGEGLIVKDALCTYSFDRDNSLWWKVKPNFVADLRVIGYQLSDDPLLPGAMGALICQTECGEITVEVGSGFSILDRGYCRVEKDDGTFYYEPIPEYNINNWVGKIIELKYFGVTHTKDKYNNSLFLPRVELFANRASYGTDYLSGELCLGIVRDKKEANYAKELKGYHNA